MEKVIVQKLKKAENEPLNKAIRYYSILSAVNDLQLTEREIQLVAFTAIHGNISYNSNKEDFCKKYNSSTATINNISSKLRKMGVFVKDGSKMKVNPVIVLDFDKMISLEIKLVNNV